MAFERDEDQVFIRDTFSLNAASIADLCRSLRAVADSMEHEIGEVADATVVVAWKRTRPEP